MNISPPTRFYALSYLVNALREAILNRQWKQVLPPERELAQRFNVSRSTLRKALHVLEEDGLLLIRQGKPTGICFPTESVSSPQPRQAVLVNVAGEEPASPSLHGLYLNVAKQLGQAGVEYREVTLSPHTCRGPAQLLGQVCESDACELIWIVFYPEERIEAWFAEHAPSTTLLVGMGSPRLALPCIDIDRQAVGRHIGMIAARHHYDRLWLICGGASTSRLNVVADGIRESIADVPLKLCHIDTSFFSERFPALLARIRGTERPLIVFHEPSQVAPALFHLARSGWEPPALLSIGNPDHLERFGVNLARYEGQEEKLARAVVQQMIDLSLFPEQPLRQHLFIPSFHAGETLIGAA